MKLIDSIRGSLTDAFQNNITLVENFLQQRQQEVLIGTDQTNGRHDNMTSRSLSSNEILNESVGLFGKIKLLFLLQQCRAVIDLLVDVHGYQIFHRGM
jgi:hypothetical protein